MVSVGSGITNEGQCTNATGSQPGGERSGWPRRLCEGMKRSTIITLALAVGVTLVALVAWPRPTAESVLNDFLFNDAQRAEDMLVDPLILHADVVKHRVLEEIQDPAMEKRRYAIRFLGIIRFSDALPALREILADDGELEYFRGDALESIYRISIEEGRGLAAQYEFREDFLGYVAKGLLDGSHVLFERTYFQALRGHHE